MRVCISGQKETYVYVLRSACAVFDAGIKTQSRSSAQLSPGADSSAVAETGARNKRRKEQATGAACVHARCLPCYQIQSCHASDLPHATLSRWFRCEQDQEQQCVAFCRYLVSRLTRYADHSRLHFRPGQGRLRDRKGERQTDIRTEK